jgi:hypothetical protein
MCGPGPVPGASRTIRCRDLLVNPLNWRRALQGEADGSYSGNPSLAAGRPILVLGEGGVAARTVADAGAGIVAHTTIRRRSRQRCGGWWATPTASCRRAAKPLSACHTPGSRPEQWPPRRGARGRTAAGGRPPADGRRAARGLSLRWNGFGVTRRARRAADPAHSQVYGGVRRGRCVTAGSRRRRAPGCQGCPATWAPSTTALCCTLATWHEFSRSSCGTLRITSGDVLSELLGARLRLRWFAPARRGRCPPMGRQMRAG